MGHCHLHFALLQMVYSSGVLTSGADLMGLTLEASFSGLHQGLAIEAGLRDWLSWLAQGAGLKGLF